MEELMDYLDHSVIGTESGIEKEVNEIYLLIDKIETGMSKEEIKQIYSDAAWRFYVKDYSLLTKKAIEAEQMADMYVNMSFVINKGVEIIVCASDIYRMQMSIFENVYPISTSEKMEMLFLSDEEKEGYREDRIYKHYYDLVLNNTKIQKELFDELPELLKNQKKKR